jgi:hypothetical protein
VPRTASTAATISGAESSVNRRLRSLRVIVSMLPSTASVSGRGFKVCRTKRSGAVKLSVPLAASGASSPCTWRSSVKFASPLRFCASNAISCVRSKAWAAGTQTASTSAIASDRANTRASTRNDGMPGTRRRGCEGPCGPACEFTGRCA